MSVSSISTFGSVQTLLSNLNLVQNSLNDSQQQISSGYKSQTFEGISSDVEKLTSLNSQVSRLNNYQQQNGITIGQLQTSNTSLGQIITAATDIKSLIASQISGTSSSTSFSQQLSAKLSSIAATLNTNYGGKYIFGGTNTASPPVQIPVPKSIITGIPDAGYYLGNSQDTISRINDAQTITPNVKANDISFQNLIAGINQALSATGGDRANTLKNAEDLVEKGLQGIIALQANVNSNILTAQQANTQSQTLQTYYKGIVSNIIESDVVALSAKVSQDTVVLQASYSTFSRITQLTLSSYLK
ncbi:MAG: hypothetical protein WCJ33_01235 [Pseudomonadota bacterium]